MTRHRRGTAMRAITPPAHDAPRRAISRDAIERFLDRSWLLERTALPTMQGNRLALCRLDDWLQRHRRATLDSASAADVRALFRSSHWDAVSRRCESLLGLTTRFYESLKDCK